MDNCFDNFKDFPRLGDFVFSKNNLQDELGCLQKLGLIIFVHRTHIAVKK
jgi:hypothetical protein